MGMRDSLLDLVRQAATDTLGRVHDLSGLLRDTLQTMDAINKADGPDDSTPEEGPPGTDEVAQPGQPRQPDQPGMVPTNPAQRDPKSLLWDPFAVVEQLGYKERYSPITYATLKAMVYKMPIVSAVIQTRLNQLASFCYPQHDRHQMGFRLSLRDSEAEPTGADRKWMKEAEAMLMRTGVTHNPRGRLNFEQFIRKSGWDSMVYDQTGWELVPDWMGRPSEWYAIDGATLRLADNQRSYVSAEEVDEVRYVQIYEGLIINEYTYEEMFFGVRNPRTDLRLNGYGVSELEMLVDAITSLLYAWRYNQNFFTQGSAQKGILNLKGTMSDKNLQQFRRHWYQMLTGVENAWRTPILNNEEGAEWISLQSTNRDMEYNAWMDFLIKVTCGVFSMDPAELNFKYGNTGQKSGMNEGSNKEKITESKERGLRPLLRFFANGINSHIIWPINENFEFKFVGLDALTREDVAALNEKRVKTSYTINEIRAEDDLPPIEGGDIILDPTFMQAQQQLQQINQQNQQALQAHAAQGTDPNTPGAPPDQPDPSSMQMPGDGTEQNDDASRFNYETEQPGEAGTAGGTETAKSFRRRLSKALPTRAPRHRPDRKFVVVRKL